MRVLSGVAAAVLALAAVSSSTAGSAAANAAAESQQIASGTAGDFRVVVTATKGDQNPPTADVIVEGFQRKGDSWQSVGSEPVGSESSWFWPVVTGTGGICEFSVADAPEPATTIRVSISPSIGCAPAETFRVDDGKLVRG